MHPMAGRTGELSRSGEATNTSRSSEPCCSGDRHCCRGHACGRMEASAASRRSAGRTHFYQVYVVYSVVRGDGDRILIGWVFLFPLGYYFLSYPRDHPVIQFDRTVVLVLVGCILATPKRSNLRPIPKDVKLVAIAWGLFLATTLISFLRTPNLLAVGRLVLEAFLLPALLGWYVMRQFRWRRHAKLLHAAICVISLYSAIMGVVEVVLQRQLLVFGDTALLLAYDPTDPTGVIFLRPNGPFTTNNSFALIGLISFFLLAFLWTVIRDDSGKASRWLHILGISAAMLQGLLPLFRSVLITIVIIIFIDLFWTTGLRRTLRLIALGLLCLLIVVGARIAAGVFKDRTSPDNVYGRIAQQEQTWKMFVDHPLIGIGFGEDFSHVALNTPRYQMISYKGVEAVNFPHNNIGWLAVQTGIVGTVPFLLSQVALIVAFWRLRKRGERGARVWRYFVFIFLSYWITGMTETAGAFGDLNIWYVFALSLLFRYGAGEASEDAAPALLAVRG